MDETNSKLILGVWYRSPNKKEVEEIQLTCWNGWETGQCYYYERLNLISIGLMELGLHFMNLLQDKLLGEIVKTPTRNNALLDLTISNRTELILDVEIRDSLVTMIIG